MKRIIAAVCICLCCLTSYGQSYQVERTHTGVQVTNGQLRVELECFSPSVIRVKKHLINHPFDKQSLSVIAQPQEVKFSMKQKKNIVTLATSQLKVTYDIASEQISFEDRQGTSLLKEKPHSAVFTEFNDAGNATYRVSQTYLPEKDEAIFGLGQHQHGLFNQRGQTIRLQQVNMEIGIPLVHSIKGYALYWDNYATTTFTDNAEGMTFDSEVGDLCDYYFVYGGNMDGVIGEWRALTGQAPLFPLWSFGFHQSRERYVSQDELVDVVRKYRELQVPLDGIVQDWRYWGEDHVNWNAIEFRNPLFPEPERMLREVHDLNAHAMISVWPSFGPTTAPFKDFQKENLLMRHETFPQNIGVKVYDAYHPRAREIYWKHMNEKMFSIGMDSWWLDATEPEHSPIVDEDYNYMTYLGSFRKVRNAFPLVSVGGVYEHQRATTQDKRVFILTRSAFAGQQRYGAQSWSGDVIADWNVLAAQIPAALNFTLSGIPYWNSDIGGFYTDKHYPGGNQNPEYQQLYVRWMQFAVFSGMMRSHGTNTPREIFQFGTKGQPVFDAQAEAIRLRYSLIPYIYSTAWQITSEAGSLMRPLFADFLQDKECTEIQDEFLFGKSFLVAPIISPENNRKVYLPAGSQWVDFWTGETLKGGQSIKAEAPLNRIPVYVKAGTVLPIGPTVQYAQEKSWDNLQLRVYPGADGEFVLYEDEADNYNYECRQYSTIRMTWNDKKRELTLHPRRGSYSGMLEKRTFRILVVNPQSGLGPDNESYQMETVYTGKKLKLRLPE